MKRIDRYHRPDIVPRTTAIALKYADKRVERFGRRTDEANIGSKYDEITVRVADLRWMCSAGSMRNSR